MDTLFLERLKTLRILYAEDEEGIRSNISASLRYYVKEVIEAENGKAALALYHKEKPDIVITDILMPLMSGIELAKIIRKEDETTPIVIISAHTDKEYLLNVVDLHLEQYIVKPVNLDELMAALSRCLKRISNTHTIVYELPCGYLYDFDYKHLTYRGELIHLNKKESAFLELLLHNKQRIVTYEELQLQVWQDDIMTDSALRSLVRNLRKKLPRDFITNLSGVGYRFEKC
ncbi:MAG: response regulator transcription factor [Sulfurospirillaceae bacterium]|nr:response regulator transcription factor [Sulfurospirillaceae bacterium]MDD2827803.1 response regulator transcription factor [Sulfurospirillaceae bacterium]